MKRILVPSDFSPQAENALKVASQLASEYDSEIFLLHSLDLPSHLANTGSTGAMPETVFFMKMAEKKFEERMNKPYLKNLRVTQTVGHGEIYNDVNEAVKTNDIDLVVMGSHGASGFKEMFIGSNAEKVVRTATIPVLVIKNEHQQFEINDFVFATDFSKECRSSFERAQKFADEVGAKIHLLYVNTPAGFKTSHEAKKMMENFVNGTNAKNYTLNTYNDSSVEKGILNFARDTNAQLVGMSTHGRKGLNHFFNGSISEDLVNHAKMPVITFKI